MPGMLFLPKASGSELDIRIGASSPRFVSVN